MVHAISEDAKRFYERRGFQPSPLDPMTLMITLRDAGRALIGENDTRSRAQPIHSVKLLHADAGRYFHPP